MKLSPHFMRNFAKRRDYLTPKLCKYVIENYMKKEVDENGRTSYWAFIEELHKYVKVIVADDCETIITAHLDDSFRYTNY